MVVLFYYSAQVQRKIRRFSTHLRTKAQNPNSQTHSKTPFAKGINLVSQFMQRDTRLYMQKRWTCFRALSLQRRMEFSSCRHRKVDILWGHHKDLSELVFSLFLLYVKKTKSSYSDYKMNSDKHAAINFHFLIILKYLHWQFLQNLFFSKRSNLNYFSPWRYV